jgi:hypothetical protein
MLGMYFRHSRNEEEAVANHPSENTCSPYAFIAEAFQA